MVAYLWGEEEAGRPTKDRFLIQLVWGVKLVKQVEYSTKDIAEKVRFT